MKINILYSLDVERSPAVSDDDRKIKAALDSLFKPLNPDILNYLHYSNSDLKLSAITALLQNDPVLKA